MLSAALRVGVCLVLPGVRPSDNACRAPNPGRPQGESVPANPWQQLPVSPGRSQVAAKSVVTPPHTNATPTRLLPLLHLITITAQSAVVGRTGLQLGLRSVRAVATGKDQAPTAMDWSTLGNYAWGSVETDFMTVCKYGPEVCGCLHSAPSRAQRICSLR